VEKLENVFKLSQNRDKESFHNIIEKLDTQHADARSIATEMKKRADTLYPNAEV